MNDEARTAIVIGASLAGLLAAAALAEVGYGVSVLERDDSLAIPRVRRGVPQGAQVHVVLDQGWRAMEAVLPGIKADVVREDAACFDSGQMPWLGEQGWLPHGLPGYPMVSVTRPLLELVIRRRVSSLRKVELRSAETVRGLARADGGWFVSTDRGVERAELVIDASGRGSRLPAWLAEQGLSGPVPDIVDARLGYATRLYSASVPIPLRSGVVIMGTLATGTGGLAMPVERGRWLLMGGGYGEFRPPRDAAGFERFLGDLRDPVLAELVERLEPQSEVAVHRQTGNRRFRYEDLEDLPHAFSSSEMPARRSTPSTDKASASPPAKPWYSASCWPPIADRIAGCKRGFRASPTCRGRLPPVPIGATQSRNASCHHSSV